MSETKKYKDNKDETSAIGNSSREKLLHNRRRIPVFDAARKNLLAASLLEDLEQNGADQVKDKYGCNLDNVIIPQVYSSVIGLPMSYFSDEEMSRGYSHGLKDITSSGAPSDQGVILDSFSKSGEVSHSLREEASYNLGEVIAVCNITGDGSSLEDLSEDSEKRSVLKRTFPKLGRCYSFIMDNCYTEHPKYSERVVPFRSTEDSLEEASEGGVDTKTYNALRKFFQQRQEDILGSK